MAATCCSVGYELPSGRPPPCRDFSAWSGLTKSSKALCMMHSGLWCRFTMASTVVGCVRPGQQVFTLVARGGVSRALTSRMALRCRLLRGSFARTCSLMDFGKTTSPYLALRTGLNCHFVLLLLRVELRQRQDDLSGERYWPRLFAIQQSLKPLCHLREKQCSLAESPHLTNTALQSHEMRSLLVLSHGIQASRRPCPFSLCEQLLPALLHTYHNRVPASNCSDLHQCHSGMVRVAFT